jgi:hypothetical protein
LGPRLPRQGWTGVPTDVGDIVKTCGLAGVAAWRSPVVVLIEYGRRRSRERDGARPGGSSRQLLQQLREEDGFVAARAHDGNAEPAGEAVAALTAPIVEEPLAAGTTLVEDVETVSVARQGRRHRLLTTGPEGTLPAGGVAVQPGAAAALVLLAAEQADAHRSRRAWARPWGVTRSVMHGRRRLRLSKCVTVEGHRGGRRGHAALLLSSRSTLTPSTKVAPARTRATRWAALTQRQRA